LSACSGYMGVWDIGNGAFKDDYYNRYLISLIIISCCMGFIIGLFERRDG